LGGASKGRRRGGNARAGRRVDERDGRRGLAARPAGESTSGRTGAWSHGTGAGVMTAAERLAHARRAARRGGSGADTAPLCLAAGTGPTPTDETTTPVPLFPLRVPCPFLHRDPVGPLAPPPLGSGRSSVSLLPNGDAACRSAGPHRRAFPAPRTAPPRGASEAIVARETMKLAALALAQ